MVEPRAIPQSPHGAERGRYGLQVEISLSEVTVADAENFWRRSPQATAFNDPIVAGKFAHSIDWWIAKRGEMPFLLWPVAQNSKGDVVIPPLSYYFGPMWSPEVLEKSITSRLADTTNCYRIIVEKFLDRYGAIEFELHPTLTDVRFFDWWNFGGSQQERFAIFPKYSAQIGNLGSSDDDFLMSKMRKVRRQEIRRFESDPRFEKVYGIPTPVFSELRREMIESQGLIEDPSETVAAAAFGSLESEGKAHTVGTRDRDSGEIVAATLTLDAKSSTNLIYSVARLEARAQGVAAWTVFNALREARDRGIEIFDFNGANSPQRGDDKHSYGANPVLYFRLRYPGLSKTLAPAQGNSAS